MKKWMSERSKKRARMTTDSTAGYLFTACLLKSFGKRSLEWKSVDGWFYLSLDSFSGPYSSLLIAPFLLRVQWHLGWYLSVIQKIATRKLHLKLRITLVLKSFFWRNCVVHFGAIWFVRGFNVPGWPVRQKLFPVWFVRVRDKLAAFTI